MLVNYFQGEILLLSTEAASKAAALPSSDELARLSRVCAQFSSSVAVLLLSSGGSSARATLETSMQCFRPVVMPSLIRAKRHESRAAAVEELCIPEKH